MTTEAREEDLLNPFSYQGKCDAAMKVKVIAHVREHGPRLGGVAKELKVAVKTIMCAMKADPYFEEAIREAEQEFVSGVEDEIKRRAVEGVEEPVFYQGAECGRITRYSDSLLTLLIKRHDHGYREKLSADVSIGGGVLVIPAKESKSDKDWASAAQRLGGGASDPDEEPDEPDAGNTLDRS